MFSSKASRSKFVLDPTVAPHEECHLTGHTNTVKVLCMLPDGRLASGAGDKTIRLWNVQTGVCEATLTGHTHYVTALTVLPDGRLASGSYDKTIRLWDTSTGSCLSTLSGHMSDKFALAVQVLKVLSDGRLVSGMIGHANCSDYTIHIWDTVKSRHCFSIGKKSWVSALEVLPDGHLAIAYTKDETWDYYTNQKGSIELFNVQSSTLTGSLYGHESFISALTTLSNGRLASGSNDYTIKIWNTCRLTCEATLSGHRNWISAIVELLDGRLASSGCMGGIKLWNMHNLTCEATLSAYPDKGVGSLVMLPDGRLASAANDSYDDDKMIRIWGVGIRPVLDVTLPNLAAIFHQEESELKQNEVEAEQEKVDSLKFYPPVDLNLVTAENQAAARYREKAEQRALKYKAQARLEQDPNRLKKEQEELTLENVKQEERDVEDAQEKQDQKRVAREQVEHEEQIRQAQETAQRAEAERLAQEQKARERQEREIKEAQERQEQDKLAQVKEAATPAIQCLQLRQLWETQSADEILKAYESLITQAPNDGINYRERGEYYVFKVKQSKIARQQKAFYEKALADFDKAIDCNAADDAAAENYENVMLQLEQLSIAGTSSQKLFSSSEVSNNDDGFTFSSPHFLNEISSPTDVVLTTPEDQWKIATLDIKRHEFLGEGAYSEVYRGHWRYQDVALKIYRGTMLPERLQKELTHEMTVMKQLRCLYLVSLYGVMEEQGKYGLVLEYCSGGTLYQKLHHSDPLPWLMRITIAQDIARGLAFLHAAAIVHADLKSLNVLLTEHHRAKITDFGLSEIKSHISSTSTTSSSARAGGTVRWMAPELFQRGQKSSKASDVYALGMTFWEMVTRRLPYADAIDSSQIVRWIEKGEKETFSENEEECPTHWKDLIEQCWQEKEKRPSAETVVATVMNWPMTESAVKKPTTTVWSGIVSLNSKDVPTLSSTTTFIRTSPDAKLDASKIGLKK